MLDISNEDVALVESELNIRFDETRKQIIRNYADVQACPGSGKTTMVSAKLLILAKKWKYGQQGVCVLTHTNVAKYEIIERLKCSSDGQKLLSYPHFIGTIQEFVNKFLAIPYLRSFGCKINQIDDDTFCTKGWFLLKRQTRGYLERKKVSSLHDMKYEFVAGKLKLVVPTFNKKSSSASYQDLVSVKKTLITQGCFFYHEMYAFAEHYLWRNPTIKGAIQSRFPIVFVDEMQDTQKFQDDFLNALFLHESVKLQRFGDPDQAIYSTGEEGNQTYNTVILDKVENSHRFNNSIALLAKNLSYNRIGLNSVTEGPDQTLHTIFLVDDNSRGKVFESFATLCQRTIPRDCSRKIKTVGAVGVKKDGSLTICSYLESFDKKNSINSFKPSKLVHYFYEAKREKTWHDLYRLILEGIVRCGRIADAKLTYQDGSNVWYSSTGIKKYLKENEQHISFNTLVKKLVDDKFDCDSWKESVTILCGYFGLTVSRELECFIDFESEAHVGKDDSVDSSNKVCIEVEGEVIENEVTTIHSVKGETHAATLVLETKYHKNDVATLIEYILKDKTDKPTAKRKIKFMKQLYVAFSRPEHLLCVAMDKSGFPTEHVNKAEYAGWKICDLTVS